MKRRIITGCLSAFGLLLLILDAKTAIYGASEGLRLCLQAVIPSLFPFFILSILLTDALTGTNIPLLRPLGKLCGIPEGSESLLAVGLLGGYPVGAQCVAQMYKSGRLAKQDACRMLGFCSNAGPSFIFGMVAMKLSDFWMVWVLWGIQILSAITVGSILPQKAKHSVRLSAGKQESLSGALRKSIHVMAGVCGWVILFRVVIAFFDRWFLWLLPDSGQTLITGILELANGCCALDAIENMGLRFIGVSAILSFGGICVCMQTMSVTGELGLGWYLPGKILQTIISIFLAALVQSVFFPLECKMEQSPLILLLMALILSVYVIILRKFEKRGSISELVGV